MTTAIAARGLTKRFGDRTAVDTLTLEVPRGEVFGFLGPNGAGKTTTVRMLTTLIRPDAGEVEVAGVPLHEAQELRSRIGVMPESPGLYLKLSVADNLRFFCGLYGLGDVERRIDAALDAVRLGDRRNDPTGSLSKGLRQRTALARALLSEPEVLFLDEPTAGLDPEASVQVRDLVDGLRSRGMTVFLTTHRLEEAERLCDRVAIIKTRLLSIGSPDELRQGTFGSVLEVRVRPGSLSDPGSVFDHVYGIDAWTASDSGFRLDVADAVTVAPDLVRALVGAGADVLRVAEASHSLEDTYLELVQEESEGPA